MFPGAEVISTHEQDALPLCFVAAFTLKRVEIALSRTGLAPQRVGTECPCYRQPHVDFIRLMEVLRLCVERTANATSRKESAIRATKVFSTRVAERTDFKRSPAPLAAYLHRCACG